MKLQALIDKKSILINLNMDSKKRIIEFLADRVAVLEKVSEDEIIKNIYIRERIGHTYIGKGIYMPHCKISNLSVTKIVVITLKHKLYDSVVGENIKIIVGVFFPKKVTEIHFKLLKELSSFIKNKETQKKIENISTSDDLYNILLGKQ